MTIERETSETRLLPLEALTPDMVSQVLPGWEAEEIVYRSYDLFPGKHIGWDFYLRGDSDQEYPYKCNKTHNIITVNETDNSVGIVPAAERAPEGFGLSRIIGFEVDESEITFSGFMVRKTGILRRKPNIFQAKYTISEGGMLHTLVDDNGNVINQVDLRNPSV